jgi:hypothetical protein
MIVFVPTNPDPKIVLGEDPRLFQALKERDNTFFYNILSQYSIGIALNKFIPDTEMWWEDEEQFTFNYMNFLRFTPIPFYSILTILMHQYMNEDVVVVCDMSDDRRLQIIECIMAHIYERYGCRTSIVSTLEDLLYADPSEIENSANFIYDKEFYLSEVIDADELQKQIINIEEINGYHI